MIVIVLVGWILCLIGNTYSTTQLMSSSDVLTVGSTFTFTCKFKQFTAIIFKANIVECLIAGVHSDGTCEYGKGFCNHNFLYSCNKQEKLYNLTIPDTFVDESYHNTTWRCGDPFKNLSNPVLLLIYVPIQHVYLMIQPTDQEHVNIVEGERRNMTCTTNPGRPRSKIMWFMSSTNISGLSTTLKDTLENNKIISSSILELEGLMQYDNKTIYCTASNTDSTNIQSQNKTINILYKPEIHLSPTDRPLIVYEGQQNIVIQCIVNRAKPITSITYEWTTSGGVPNGNELTLNVIKKFNEGNYTCTATNTAGSSIPETLLLEVQFQPIIKELPSQSIKENDRLNISMEIIANPKPLSVWWTHQGNTKFRRNGTYLIIDAVEKSDEGIYIFHVTYKFTPSGGEDIPEKEIEKAVIIDVLYGPDYAKLTPSDLKYTISEGHGVDPINCTAKCNPDCTISWKGPNDFFSNSSVLKLQNINRNQTGIYFCEAINNIGGLMSKNISVIVHYGPAIVVLEPSNVSYHIREKESVNRIHCSAECRPNCTFIWSGPFLPKIPTSVLELNTIGRNQSGQYWCNASNIVGSKVSISVIVTIHYGPGLINLSPSNQTYSIKENSSIGPINCTADCFPVCEFFWIGPNLLMQNTSSLYLQKIDRTMAGLYHCNSSNEIGSQVSTTVKITVQYSPTVSIINGTSHYSENDTIVLICSVDSEPKSKLSWQFQDQKQRNQVVLEEQSQQTNNSFNLQIDQIKCLQMGIYICQAVNPIGNDSKNLNVTVCCSPRLNNQEFDIKRKIALSEYEPLNLTAPILAYPKPQIYWQFIRNGTVKNITGQVDNVSIVNRHFAHLLIENITGENFGEYAIFAYNSIGAEGYIFSYEVGAARRPDKASNVTCTSVSSKSIFLSWKPGFNGGSTQHFQIQYRKLAELEFQIHPQNISADVKSPVEIIKLSSSSVYILRVKAYNVYNSSESNIVQCNTTAEDITMSDSLTAIGAGTGFGAAVVLVIIVIVIIVLKRRHTPEKTCSYRYPFKKSEQEQEEEEEENDGLKPNPLYVLSGDFIPKGRSDKKISAEVYSQVIKNKKQGYVYENSADFLKDDETQLYSNDETEYQKGTEYQPKQNKDGLIYAELAFEPVSAEKKFVIHGLENKSSYAVIDLSKKAEPLPSDVESAD